MVINSSNRSPSPMWARPNHNLNPNSRSHQDREGVGVVPARKSFSGYPLGKPSIVSQPRSFVPSTPANSPAEFTKRNSFSRDHEQNENDNGNSKPNSLRPRSPSVLKGSKNFMSPTISAASKINPSPRKKVLVERNEAIRTSASLSDGKFQFFNMGSLEFSDQNDPKTIDIELPEKHVEESEADLVVLSPDVPLNVTKSSDHPLPLSEMPTISSEVKNTCSSPAVIAPLDADPSLPPYDPKTNYLSPRPQFLCYKPNPRIESYINQGLRLEDEFTSESEATQSETPHDQEDSFSSSSSTEVSSNVEEMPPFSESKPSESQEIQEAFEPEIEPGSRFFTKSRMVAFLLIFLVGLMFYPVTYYPGFGKATSMYNDPHSVIDLAKVNFNGLVHRTKLWSAHSVSHLSQMMMVHNIRGVNEFGPVTFSNLTDWAEEEEVEEEGDHIIEDFSLIEQEEQEMMEDFSLSEQQEMMEDFSLSEQEYTQEKSLVERVTGLEPEEEEEDSVDDVEDSKADLEDGDVDMMGQRSPIDDEAENQEVEHTQEKEAYMSSDVELQNTESCSSQFPSAHQTRVEDINPEDEIESQTDGAEVLGVPLPKVDDQSIVDTEETMEKVDIDSTEAPEVPPLLSPIATVGLAVLTLLVSTATIVAVYVKAKKAASPTQKLVMEKSVASAKELSVVHGSPSSCSGPVEVDMSEPCPSEMSSFHKTLSHHSKRNTAPKKSDEAQSQSREEKRPPRRDYSKSESLASSSSEYTVGSSYGSFTTYSIMPSKKGDEEVVTPVRRSSRIRKQVTSP